VINRLGLSRAFDLMVLEKIIHLCETGKCQSIFVISLFPSTVRNHHFFEKVQMLFTENRAARGRILFMLAEREYHNQIHRYNDILQSYRRMGLLIGLDRLGSHHTTMLYMREMEVDVVRYDMHYGKHIADTRTQALIRGLDLSAHCLGVKSWIKMIEDHSGLQIAEDIGINFVQGNHIGRLASLEDFLEKNE
jgi:EAL domain-containing protein (putative c-di-GMP-specific phosphodiesterase class I)